MSQALITEFERLQFKQDRPSLAPGDTVQVRSFVTEGDKRRLQAFQGVVISIRGSGIGESFTVRRQSGHCIVERVFPIHSPIVEEIRIIGHAKVRRAKLFYLRKLSGKAARLKQRFVKRTPKSAE